MKGFGRRPLRDGRAWSGAVVRKPSKGETVGRKGRATRGPGARECVKTHCPLAVEGRIRRRRTVLPNTALFSSLCSEYAPAGEGRGRFHVSIRGRYCRLQPTVHRSGSTQQLARSIGLAAAVGIVYFLAARLSLLLLTKPDGVAVFWPASGVAAGVLIALGPRARLPVAAGAMVATIVAISG